MPVGGRYTGAAPLGPDDARGMLSTLGDSNSDADAGRWGTLEWPPCCCWGLTSTDGSQPPSACAFIFMCSAFLSANAAARAAASSASRSSCSRRRRSAADSRTAASKATPPGPAPPPGHYHATASAGGHTSGKHRTPTAGATHRCRRAFGTQLSRALVARTGQHNGHNPVATTPRSRPNPTQPTPFHT